MTKEVLAANTYQSHTNSATTYYSSNTKDANQNCWVVLAFLTWKTSSDVRFSLKYKLNINRIYNQCVTTSTIFPSHIGLWVGANLYLLWAVGLRLVDNLGSFDISVGWCWAFLRPKVSSKCEALPHTYKVTASLFNNRCEIISTYHNRSIQQSENVTRRPSLQAPIKFQLCGKLSFLDISSLLLYFESHGEEGWFLLTLFIRSALSVQNARSLS